MVARDQRDVAQSVIAEAEKAVAELGGAHDARADRLAKLHELFTVVEQRYLAQQQDLADRDEHIRVLSEVNDQLTTALRSLAETAHQTARGLGDSDTDLARAVERSESLVAQAFGTGGNANPTQAPDAVPLPDDLDLDLSETADVDLGEGDEGDEGLMDLDVDVVEGGAFLSGDEDGDDGFDGGGDGDDVDDGDVSSDGGDAEESGDLDALTDDLELEAGDGEAALTSDMSDEIGAGDDAGTADEDDVLTFEDDVPGDSDSLQMSEGAAPADVADSDEDTPAATADDSTADDPARDDTRLDDTPPDDAARDDAGAGDGDDQAETVGPAQETGPARKGDDPLIAWCDSWSVGAPEMDRDHRILINLVNKLPAALDEAEESGWGVGGVLNCLWDYTEYHFNREEALLKAANFPGAEDHGQRHSELKAQVRDWLDRYQADPDAIDGPTLVTFLKSWLMNHILGEDMRYKPYVQNNPDAQAVAAAIAVDPDLIEDLGDAAIVADPAH